MHLYLKSIGFDHITKVREVNRLLEETAGHADHQIISSMDKGESFCVLSRDCGQSMGISLYGELDEQDQILPHGYFPYFYGSEVSSICEVSVERRMEDERYLGMFEDDRVGISLIFTAINGAEYVKNEELKKYSAKTSGDKKNESGKNRIKSEILRNVYEKTRPIILSGLALEGMILFPVKKEAISPERELKNLIERKKLITAAKRGDQDAMDKLAFGDMDQYYTATKRLESEDVFSIVETYFMPYGIECDLYSIMGEIMAIRKRENIITKEEIYQLKLCVNGIHMDVCLPVKQLTGEPEIGRRFKGVIWLQGVILN